MSNPEMSTSTKVRNWVIVIAVGAAIWLTPVPEGVDPSSWHLLALFVATIVGFILQPVPMGAMAIIAITLSVLLKVIPLAKILSGFGGSVIWLVVMAFLLAKGFGKTGLGKRISLLLVKAIGTSTLKLSYALSISDFLFAPATPSITARGGGIVYPIIQGLCEVFDSKPGATARRVGAYLIQVEHHAVCITSAIFLTGMATNPLVAELAGKTVGVELSWTSWATAAIVPGLVALFLIPFILYMIFPPEIKKTPEAPEMAKNQLAEMGPMSRGEKIMLFVFLLCLALWSTSSITKLSATIVAFLAIAILLFTETLTWDDCLSDKGAWDALIWIGTLIAMATFLGAKTEEGQLLNVIPWFSQTMGEVLVGMAWLPTLSIILLVYVFSHYAFASLSAHISALYAPLLAVAVAAGAPAALAAILLAVFSNLCGSLTHYSSGPAPIFFGAGYIDQPTWWKFGFIITVVNLVIWSVVGGVWWKILGLW